MAETTNKTIVGGYKSGTKGTYGGSFPRIVSSFDTRGTTSYTSSFTGTKNPSWRDDIRMVRNATTSASGTRRRVKFRVASGYASGRSASFDDPPNEPGLFSRFTSCEFAVPSLSSGSFPGTTSPTITSADNQAIARLYEALRSFESSVNAGEDLGEIGKTINTIKSPLSNARNLMTRVIGKHRDALSKPSAREAARALGSTLLEYRFGIEPLVNTIADAMVGFQNRDYLAHYYPFNESATVKSKTTTQSTAPVGNLSVTTVYKESLSEKVRYSGVWGVQVDLNTRSVADVMSWRLQDVIPTVWELVPYSWLADYFTNIGDIIGGISVPWSGVRWCNKTVRSVRERHMTFTDWYQPGLKATYPYRTQSNFTPGFTQMTETAFTRSRQESLPRPTFEIRFDRSLRHWTNIGALVLSRIPVIRRTMQNMGTERTRQLQSSFALEVGRRGLRTPYPFHP